MSDATTVTVEGRTVALERAVSFGSGPESYALGRRRTESGFTERVLVPMGAAQRDGGRPTGDAAIQLPDDLAEEIALLVPAVVEALRAWDLLELEMGAAAVVIGATPWSALMLEVGGWYGAKPLHAGLNHEPGAVDVSDPDAVTSFRKTLEAYPVVCALELTGRAAAAEFLFESVPPQARTLFAGPPAEHLTIDYYVNVHRKGLRLHSTVLDPARAFAPAAADRVRRALALLHNGRRAAVVETAVSDALARIER